MRSWIGVLFLTVFWTLASPVAALDVKMLDWHVLDQWLSKSQRPVVGHFADTTILFKLTSRGTKGIAGIPSSGPLVVYLAKNGKMLTWTPKSKTVGSGTWEIKDFGLGVEIPCYYFDTPKGKSECFIGGTANYLQSAKGNPFGLVAGQAVPAQMTGSSTILTLAQKLGL